MVEIKEKTRKQSRGRRHSRKPLLHKNTNIPKKSSKEMKNYSGRAYDTLSSSIDDSNRLNPKTYAADWVINDWANKEKKINKSDQIPADSEFVLAKVAPKISKENKPLIYVLDGNNDQALNIRYDYFNKLENEQRIWDIVSQFQEKGGYLPLHKKTLVVKKRDNPVKEIVSYEIDTELLELIDSFADLDQPVGKAALNYPLSSEWYSGCICGFDVHKNPLVFTKQYGVTLLTNIREDVTPKYGDYVDLCLNKSSNSGNVVTHCCYSARGTQGKQEGLYNAGDIPQVSQGALITDHPLQVDEGFAVQREQLSKHENQKQISIIQEKIKPLVRALFEKDNNPYIKSHPADKGDTLGGYSRLSSIELSVLEFGLSGNQVDPGQKVWSSNGIPGVIIDPAKDEDGKDIIINGKVRVQYFRRSKTGKKGTTIAMTNKKNLWGEGGNTKK